MQGRNVKFASLILGGALGALSMAQSVLRPQTVEQRVDASRTASAEVQKGTVVQNVQPEKRAVFGSGVARGRSGPRHPGPGWSNRHVQRMARKRRNVLRNRKAHRG